MPLSTSYAICEAFGWESGISKNFREAPVFMSLFTLLLLLGAIVVLIPGISLIPLIISAQIANGILLPIILIFILRLATDRRVMGDAVNGRLTTVLGWGVAALAGSLSLGYLLVSFFLPSERSSLGRRATIGRCARLGCVCVPSWRLASLSVSLARRERVRR